MKTIKFHQTEATEYLVGIKDRAEVGVVLRDRTDHDNYNGVTVRAFYEIAAPEALAAFERKIAAALAFAYDRLRREEAFPPIFPRAEIFLGEIETQTDAGAHKSRWFFSRDGGKDHVVRVDGVDGKFLPTNSVYVDLKAFWRLTGIDHIQENLRAYRDGEPKAA